MTSGLGYGTAPELRLAPGPAHATRSRLGLSLFLREDGGFTTVAVAAALLVTLALTFSVVGAQWTQARAADVQAVADACAMAGSDVVAAYTTVAQALDALVLSLGLLGVIVMGVGLVVAAIPGLGPAGLEVVNWGSKVLRSRRDFAKGCMRGLETLEDLLPGLVVANSAAVVGANGGGLVHYGGCAVPFPLESRSRLTEFDDGLDPEALEQAAEELRQASDEAKAAAERADELRERGWRADCGAEPRCLRERAEALAGLSGYANPSYPSADGWNFGVPLARARGYYTARFSGEVLAPAGADVREVRDAACRAEFYAYALEQVNAGSYEEDWATHKVLSCNLPSLPRNTEEMRATHLYTDMVWPVSSGSSGLVLHASIECPAAAGVMMRGSLAMQEDGLFGTCEVCRMSSFYMGQVASATTNTAVGFEHWWRQVQEASVDYAQARNEQLEAEERVREAQSKADEGFRAAIELLGVPRPHLCPPGAYGCVAIVLRPGGAQAQIGPSVFASEAQLSAGGAISAATLAPDDATEDNDVLASFFDALVGDVGELSVGAFVDGVMGLWGRLLRGYGKLYERLDGAADTAFEFVGSLPGGEWARTLRRRISDVADAGGFSPADIRLRKPVLVNSAQVMAHSGEDIDDIRSTLQSLPDDAGAMDVAKAFALHYVDSGDIPEEVTVAELPIPGTELTIPLTFDVRELVGAL